MASPLVLIHRILGLAAARRALRRLAAAQWRALQQCRARPVEGLGKTLGIAWNVLFNKPRNTVPAGQLPVDSLTRAELDAAPIAACTGGHSTLLLSCAANSG